MDLLKMDPVEILLKFGNHFEAERPALRKITSNLGHSWQGPSLSKS